MGVQAASSRLQLSLLSVDKITDFKSCIIHFLTGYKASSHNNDNNFLIQKKINIQFHHIIFIQSICVLITLVMSHKLT